MISAKFDNPGGQAFGANRFDIEHYKINLAQRAMLNRIMTDLQMTRFQVEARIVANQIPDQRGSQFFVGMREPENHIYYFGDAKTPAVLAQQIESFLYQRRIRNEIAMGWHCRAL